MLRLANIEPTVGTRGMTEPDGDEGPSHWREVPGQGRRPPGFPDHPDIRPRPAISQRRNQHLISPAAGS